MDIFYIKTKNDKIVEIDKNYLKYFKILSIFENELDINNEKEIPFHLFYIDDFDLKNIIYLFDNKDDDIIQEELFKRLNKDDLFRLLDIANYLDSTILINLLINYITKFVILNDIIDIEKWLPNNTSIE